MCRVHDLVGRPPEAGEVADRRGGASVGIVSQQQHLVHSPAEQVPCRSADPVVEERVHLLVRAAQSKTPFASAM